MLCAVVIDVIERQELAFRLATTGTHISTVRFEYSITDHPLTGSVPLIVDRADADPVTIAECLDSAAVTRLASLLKPAIGPNVVFGNRLLFVTESACFRKDLARYCHMTSLPCEFHRVNSV